MLAVQQPGSGGLALPQLLRARDREIAQQQQRIDGLTQRLAAAEARGGGLNGAAVRGWGSEGPKTDLAADEYPRSGFSQGGDVRPAWQM